jgi:uncharacterized membrane protein HdeD (DUF308 family)
MTEYLKILMILPVLLFGYQLFRYTVTLKREEKQRACRSLGIIIFPAGVVCLVFHNFYAVIAGLVMIMSGLRLIAYGLERKDKNIFIDRYDEDSKKNE